MKNKHLLFLAAVLMLICFGCSNDDEDSADLASNVTGLYSGYWNAYGGKHSGTCEVIFVSNTEVKLEMEIRGVSIPEIPDVKLSDGGNGKIVLKYTDSSGNLNGTIQSKTITVSIADGSTTISFTGAKP